MSVNIFGSSGRQPSKSDNKYVDRKFITLTSNLDSKMDKSGGIFSGGVSSSHVPTDNFHLINKAFLDAALAHRLNDDDMKIIENRLSLKVNKSGDTLTGSLSSSHIPTENFDLINKIYLKSIYIKNSRGYIPDLFRVSSKTGFKVTSSGDIKDFPSYHAFNASKTHWLPADKNNGWLQIELPEFVRIYKVALFGKTIGESTSDRINSFTLLGSKYGTTSSWIELFTIEDDSLGPDVSFFPVNNTTTFKFFKLLIHGSIGEKPGLSHFRIYCLDSVA